MFNEFPVGLKVMESCLSSVKMCNFNPYFHIMSPMGSVYIENSYTQN